MSEFSRHGEDEAFDRFYEEHDSRGQNNAYEIRAMWHGYFDTPDTIASLYDRELREAPRQPDAAASLSINDAYPVSGIAEVQQQRVAETETPDLLLRDVELYGPNAFGGHTGLAAARLVARAAANEAALRREQQADDDAARIQQEFLDNHINGPRS